MSAAKPPKRKLTQATLGETMTKYRAKKGAATALQDDERDDTVDANEFVTGIVGLRPEESDALLALLRRGVEDPNVHVRWRWQRHDVVVWDERCTNHRAVGDHWPAHRLVRRCTAGASRPEGPGGSAA